MPTERTPRVGDHVFYFAHGSLDGKYPAGKARAAVITAVVPEGATLCIFNPTGLFFSPPLARSPRHESGFWDWDSGEIQQGGVAPLSAAASEAPHLCAICVNAIRTNDVFYTTTDGEMICATCRARGEA